MQPDKHRRIRSFVRREGRLTPAQARALATLLPRYGVPPGAAAVNFQQLFGRKTKHWLEIGFGNGDNLLALAGANPDIDFLGLEVHRPGLGRLLLALDKQGIDNVRVADADAVVFLRERIEDGALQRVQLLFPDPWPKKRHHKRRIVQPEFVAEIHRVLESGGIFQLATDWTPYAEHMLEVINANSGFENLAADNRFVERPATRPVTRFEQRGDTLGHPIYDLMFQRR